MSYELHIVKLMNVYRMQLTERQTDKIPQLSLVGFLLVYQPEKVQIQIIDHTHSTIVLYVIFVKENPDMQVLKLSGLSICCNHQMVTFRTQYLPGHQIS